VEDSSGWWVVQPEGEILLQILLQMAKREILDASLGCGLRA
jgi:hypothetical protein